MAKKTADHKRAIEQVLKLESDKSLLMDDLTRTQSELVSLNRQRGIDLAALDESKRLLDLTTAGSLLKKGVEFICIDAEEPYYMETYRSIRRHAMVRGTWTANCEKEFRAALEKWLNRVSVKERDGRWDTLTPGMVEVHPR